MVHFNILKQKEDLQLCLFFCFSRDVPFCQQLLMVDTLGSLNKPGL